MIPPHAASPDAIRQCLQRGDIARARALLDQGLALAPQHPELRYLRGMLQLDAGANTAALADFDAALHVAPDLPPLLFNRGLALFRLERLAEALADFRQLAQQDAGDASLWTNIGIIHSRLGEHREAIDALRRARLLQPDAGVVLRSLANALREVGELDESLRLHQQVQQREPRDPSALTDHALCLLSLRRHHQAQALYRAALDIDRGDQTALAGLYMTSNELGDAAQVQRLMDYAALLGLDGIGAEDGIDADVLRRVALANDGLMWEPAGRSTRLGLQSPMLDAQADPHLARLHAQLEARVAERMRRLQAQPGLQDHPWLAAMPRHWRLQSWITVIESGGRQTPHIHPAGWLSGVYYIDSGQPDVLPAGALQFGHAQAELPLQQAPHERSHQPRSGELVLFPSYFLHNTVPFSGNGPRISLAFDVVPLPAARS